MLSAISALRKDYEEEDIKVVPIVTEKTADRPNDSSSETPIVTIKPIERTESFDDIVEIVGSLFQTRSVAPASDPLNFSSPSFLDSIKAKIQQLNPTETLRRTSFFKMGTIDMESALKGRAEIIAGQESDDSSDNSDSDSDDDLFKTVFFAPTEKAVEIKSAPLIDRSFAENATINSMLAKITASPTDKKNSRTEATAEDSDNDWD